MNQPFPYNNQPWIIVALSTIIVVFVLWVFRPFGLDRIVTDRFLVLLGYGMVTAIGTSVVCVIFPMVFCRFYAEKKWTIWKNILNLLIILIVVSLGNTLFDYFTYHRPAGMIPSLIKMYVVATVSVGIFPIIVITFIVQNQSLKYNLNKAKELNLTLSSHAKEDENAGRIKDRLTFIGDTKESLTLLADNVLYVEAAGNYVSVYYTEDGIARSKMIRSTVKQMEELLIRYPLFIRCHRAFIVNTKHIQDISGNAQGCKLSLRYVEMQVPVSRSYIKSLKEHLVL